MRAYRKARLPDDLGGYGSVAALAPPQLPHGRGARLPGPVEVRPIRGGQGGQRRHLRQRDAGKAHLLLS